MYVRCIQGTSMGKDMLEFFVIICMHYRGHYV